MKRGLIMVVLGLALSFAAHATMYKWIDDKGKTHYGDTIPPEYANQGNAQLNASGQVVKKTDAAMTPAQIKARDEAAAKAKKENEEALERQRRDKTLLASYSEEKEIDLALLRNVGQFDVQVKSNELRIKYIESRIEKLKKQEAMFAKIKKPNPPDLVADMQQAEQEIDHLRGNIAALEKEKEAMRKRYAEDKARFRELKGYPPETSTPASVTPVVAPAPASKK